MEERAPVQPCRPCAARVGGHPEKLHVFPDEETEDKSVETRGQTQCS